ncbi:MAG: PDZ domain-containing protein [Gemmataceae bacterium]
MILRILAASLLLAAPLSAQQPDVNAAIEGAMKASIAKVAPAVVKIETAGGLEVATGTPPKGGPAPKGKSIAVGTGATTGLIVDAEGYVITSSFNFANKPTDIFVTVPNRPTRFVAKVVATDQTRMLTLLKIDAKDLPVPAAMPKKDAKVGQWAMALGRTLDTNLEHAPSVSTGILSAANRLHGKAFQTDAKTSPTNYGGPLIGIDGRVFGVIIPASARGEGETSGFEWYDSGIGFAIPLEDILAKLPDLKKGGTLRRGLLGINPQTPDQYNTLPEIGAIQPDSAAARAGLKVGDKILAIDDKPTPNFSTLQHILGPKYENDAVKLKVSREGKEMEIAKVILLGTATAYVNPFLGILPMRDEAQDKPGVVIRHVYANSPAAAAGLKEGDRIMKAGPAAAMQLPPIRNAAQLSNLLSQFNPGMAVKIEVKRKEGEKTETVTATLSTLPDAIPDKLPMPSSFGKALEGVPKKKDEPGLIPKKKDKAEKVETGFLERTDEALGRQYWLYVPDNYDPNTSHGVLVWFHPVGKAKDGELMARTFREFCEDHHYIVMGPKANNPQGWLPSETEAVVQDVRKVLAQYTTDKTRVVAHGMGNGGQMAFYVAFNARDVFRGVATLGATLGTPPKDNVANQPLAFHLSVGDKDPAIKDVEASKQALQEKRFPVVYRLMNESGKEYYDLKIFTELLVWLDSLDRI